MIVCDLRIIRMKPVASSASDRQFSKFEFCVWSAVSSHSSHHPQEVLLTQFNLYVHKGSLKPLSFILICAIYIPYRCEYDEQINLSTYIYIIKVYLVVRNCNVFSQCVK